MSRNRAPSFVTYAASRHSNFANLQVDTTHPNIYGGICSIFGATNLLCLIKPGASYPYPYLCCPGYEYSYSTPSRKKKERQEGRTLATENVPLDAAFAVLACFFP